MNNMMFSLSRYLRDEGYDCNLFLLNDEPKHFHPSCDSYNDEYISYTIELPFGKNEFCDLSETEVNKIFEGYEFFIGTDFAPALLFIGKIKLNVFIPHGSDLFLLPFMYRQKRTQSSNRIWWAKNNWYNSKLLFYGVNNCENIFVPNEYDALFTFEKKFSKQIKYFNFTGPLLYSGEYTNDKMVSAKLIYKNRFDEIRLKYDLIVFSHSRQFWNDKMRSSEKNGKGNDKLIRGFSDFVKTYSGNAVLILFEYGQDIDASKKLILQENISNKVIWMPVMPRKEIMYGIFCSDICAGEFHNPWLTGGAVSEVLLLNKPLLHYAYNGEKKTYYLFNVKSAREITESLLYFTNHKNLVIEQCKMGAKWVNAHLNEPSINQLKLLLNSTLTLSKSNHLLKNTRVRRMKILLRLKITFFKFLSIFVKS